MERTPDSAWPTVRLESLIVRQDASPSNIDTATTLPIDSLVISTASPSDEISAATSTLPSSSSTIPASPSSAPKTFKIMSRTPSQKSSSRQSSRTTLPSTASSVSSADGPQPDSKRNELSYEARQAAYQQARNRIFAGANAGNNATENSTSDNTTESTTSTPEDDYKHADGSNQSNPFNSDPTYHSTSSDNGRGWHATAIAKKGKETMNPALRANKTVAKLRPSATAFDPSAKAHGYEEVTIIDLDDQHFTMPCNGSNMQMNLPPSLAYSNGYARNPRLGYPIPENPKIFSVGAPAPPPAAAHPPYMPMQHVMQHPTNSPYLPPHYPVMHSPFAPPVLPPYPLDERYAAHQYTFNGYQPVGHPDNISGSTMTEEYQPYMCNGQGSEG